MNVHQAEYLLVGAFAVGFHGYPRATQAIDIWIRMSAQNAERIVAAIREFGFDTPNLRPDLFLQENKITQMGKPPSRTDILTTIPGVQFESCQKICVVTDFNGIPVSVISLPDLKTNKLASGHHKDLADIAKVS